MNLSTRQASRERMLTLSSLFRSRRCLPTLSMFARVFGCTLACCVLASPINALATLMGYYRDRSVYQLSRKAELDFPASGILRSNVATTVCILATRFPTLRRISHKSSRKCAHTNPRHGAPPALSNEVAMSSHEEMLAPTFYSVFERSMFSDLTRGWALVRVKKTRQTTI